jgi:hypothetical protein
MVELLVKCDVCKKPAKTYRYSIGCSMDASGNGYNEDWVYKDFCFNCVVDFIRQNGKIELKEYKYRYPNMEGY